MTRTTRSDLSQSGNIIVYVLGAIFLMGVLIVMVRGSNTPGASIDTERLMVIASEVQQYGNELEMAVSNIIRQGYSESDIRVALPGSGPTGIEDEPRRQLFSREGGAALVRKAPSAAAVVGADWAFTTEFIVAGVGTTCAAPGPDCAELIALVQVNQGFCKQINMAASLITADGEPPALSSSFSSFSTTINGTFIGDKVIEDADDVLKGRKEACFNNVDSGTNKYYYYRVLLAR